MSILEEPVISLVSNSGTCILWKFPYLKLSLLFILASGAIIVTFILLPSLWRRFILLLITVLTTVLPKKQRLMFNRLLRGAFITLLFFFFTFTLVVYVRLLFFAGRGEEFASLSLDTLTHTQWNTLTLPLPCSVLTGHILGSRPPTSTGSVLAVLTLQPPRIHSVSASLWPHHAHITCTSNIRTACCWHFFCLY